METLLRTKVNGALATRNRLTGRTRTRAAGSGRVIASIFGTCSPTVIWRDVAIVKASANEIATATL